MAQSGYYAPVPAKAPQTTNLDVPAGTFCTNTPANGQVGNGDNRLDGLFWNTAKTGEYTHLVPNVGATPAVHTTQWGSLNLDNYLYPLITADVAGGDRFNASIRQCYSGFEIINDTPIVEQGGSLTVCDQADEPNVRFFNNAKLAISGGTGSVKNVRVGTARLMKMPPSTIAEASQCQGSKTWAASEGCLVPAKFLSEPKYSDVTVGNCIFVRDTSTYTGVPLSASSGGPSSIMCGDGGVNVYSAGATEYDFGDDVAMVFSHHNQPSVYLTGLPKTTSLRVVWKTGFTYCPSPANTLGLATASTPPEPCENAFALYAEAAHNLPIGVPRSMNDAGDWLRMVGRAMNTALSALPMVGKMVSTVNPLLGGVMQGIGVAGGLARSAIREVSAEQSSEAKMRRMISMLPTQTSAARIAADHNLRDNGPGSRANRRKAAKAAELERVRRAEQSARDKANAGTMVVRQSSAMVARPSRRR
jgi:hypothetical protein